LRTSSRIRGAAAAAGLICLTLGAAGCGGSVGTITVEDAAPTRTPAAARVVVATRTSVGPGAFRTSVATGPYRISVGVTPNRASTPNRFTVAVSRDGSPVRDARVQLTAEMETMDMGVATYDLAGRAVYTGSAPAWVMPGRWRLIVSVHPAGEAVQRVALDDSLRG
jgi:hypothetical protein